jgi:hypothetical protein
MTTPPDTTACTVLRCLNTAAGFVPTAMPYDPVDVAVCAEHRQRMESGDIWDFDESLRRVLMGDDLPPRIRQFTVKDSLGTKGWTLALETSDDPAAAPLSVFLTPEDTDWLMGLFKDRGTSASDG